MRGDGTPKGDRDTQDYVDYVSARLARWHRAAYLLCGDEHRADDLVQTTVTKLYVHWARARAADKIDYYVHRMLVRTFLDERRLAWSKVRLMSATPEQGTAGDTGVEDRDLVVRALEELPKGQRTVLVMRFLCDMPVEQVAEGSDVPRARGAAGTAGRRVRGGAGQRGEGRSRLTREGEPRT
jgi:RNA polymerase sigma factor (sigma-70 family)